MRSSDLASPDIGLAPSSQPAATRARSAALAALIVLWLAATLWVRPLMLPDEGRYVGVAWEMLRSGDWLTPRLDGMPFFDKPPLFYWLTTAGLQLFGAHAWAARMAPLLGGLLAAFSLALFSRRWADRDMARLLLPCLLVQPLFYLGSQFANMDMLVAGCISATTLLLADAALRVTHGQPHRRALLLACTLAALGVLAKGLIGAVLPAAVVLLWLAWMGRWTVLRALLWWPGLLLFVALALPWFVVMQWQNPGFFHYFIVVQHVQRFAAGGFNNVQPAWFYIAVLLLFSLPFVPWLGRLLVLRGRATGSGQPLQRLMLAWLALIVVFFSIPRSKPLGYILPAVPPLAWLMVDGLRAAAAPSRRARQLWLASLLGSALVCVAAVVVVAQRPTHTTLALARVLQGQRQAGEPVVMVGTYAHDLPFYARLDVPLPVVDDWSNPDVARLDNWRRELADAGSFAPGLAAGRLIGAAALGPVLCAAPVSWLVGPPADKPQPQALARWGALKPVYSGPGGVLWRVPRDLPALGCAAPRSGSGGKVDAGVKALP